MIGVSRAENRLDLRTLLLGGGYQWIGNPPVSMDDIDALVAESPIPLPQIYLALLELSDGGHASLSGYPSYVRIWSARTVIEYNRDYQVQQYLPEFVAFGDSGGPDMVGFDMRRGAPYPVCAVPFAPMEWAAEMGRVVDFQAFIEQLLPVEKGS